MYKLSLLPLKSRERSKRTFEIKLISNSNSSFKKSKKKKKNIEIFPFPPWISHEKKGNERTKRKIKFLRIIPDIFSPLQEFLPEWQLVSLVFPTIPPVEQSGASYCPGGDAEEWTSTE